MDSKDSALRKRTQITKASRTMFLWVAGVSVILGFALVGSIFLVQKLLFNERVLAEKTKTSNVLKTNVTNASELESQVRVLDSNSALLSAKAAAEDQTLQVILDALPSKANSYALGASLQTKLLAGVDGLVIQSLQVTPVAGVETLGVEGAVEDASTTTSATGSGEILFRFTVAGSDTAMRQVLERMERSIRAIDVISLTIESQGDARILSVEARAFYEPARVVQLTDKAVK
jgi:hypothetical protein